MNFATTKHRAEKPTRPLSAYLPYEPPYDWETLLTNFRIHQIPHLEAVNDVEYVRLTATSRGMGWFRVTHHPQKNSLRLQAWNATAGDMTLLVAAVRRMFDLDANLAAISKAMKLEPLLSRIWQRHPGLRVARSRSGFESMVTTILGQLVSVSFGRVLTSELMDAAGTMVAHPKTGEQIRLFPTADELLKADLSKIRTSESRRLAIRSLAALVADGTLQWNREIEHDKLRKLLLSIPGIGAWTSEYVAMHGFQDDDAFPGTDYVLKQQLKRYPRIEVKKVRPWRAYAAIALWKDYSHSG